MQVFISYAREDFDKADLLFKYLDVKGIKIWMDKLNLSPGQRWEKTIEQEIKDAKIFLALLSNTSVRKEGFVQKEFKLAVNQQDMKPSDGVYIIPVILEPCRLPDEFAGIQAVDLSTPDGYESVYQAIQKALEVDKKYGGGSVTMNSLSYALHSATVSGPKINDQKKDYVYQAPFPGIFYRGRSPNEGPYRRDGDSFQKGDPLFIIECYKTFFEFSADEDGIVGAFLAKNGDFIKDKSPLFLFYYEKNRRRRS